MSSQLVVYGYIEIPTGSERANAECLTALISQHDQSGASLPSSIASVRSGWPSPTMSFARSFKKTDDEQHKTLQKEFEFVLRSMVASSAHLSIQDDEGLVNRHFEYSFGPIKFGEPNTWSCVSSTRNSAASEESIE